MNSSVIYLMIWSAAWPRVGPSHLQLKSFAEPLFVCVCVFPGRTFRDGKRLARCRHRMVTVNYANHLGIMGLFLPPRRHSKQRVWPFSKEVYKLWPKVLMSWAVVVFSEALNSASRVKWPTASQKWDKATWDQLERF